MACFGGAVDAARREYRVIITAAEQAAYVPRWVGVAGYIVTLVVFGIFIWLLAPVMYIGESHRRGHWLSRDEFAHLKHHDEDDDGEEDEDQQQGTSAQDALDAAAYSLLYPGRSGF